MSEQTSFPLCWPAGWPRTQRHLVTQSRFFKSQNKLHTMSEVRQVLSQEIDRLDGRNAVLSTNVKLRLDGTPYSNQVQPADTGAAVYFTLKGKPVSLACDRWNRVEDNVWAIVKHIEALRGQNRWGVGNIEQAFRGYTALPESTDGSWCKVLGVSLNASAEQVKEAYRILVKRHHPDSGGDSELFRRVQEAYQHFERLNRHLDERTN